MSAEEFLISLGYEPNDAGNIKLSDIEAYALKCMKKACKKQRENCVGGWRKSKDENGWKIVDAIKLCEEPNYEQILKG